MNNTLTTHIQNQVLTNPTKLNENLQYNNIVFNHRLEYDNIKEYIDKFLEGENINRYLVLPGIRGVGKSTLLYQTYEYLLKEKHIPQTNILHVSGDNLKRMSNSSIMDAIESYLKTFHDATIETIKEPVFILVDEAQYDEDWSMTGKILFDNNKNIFMIFTGSAALELNYNADSARRLLKIPITPLSYHEHLRLKYNNFENNFSKQITDMIFDGKMDNYKELELKILKNYANFKNYDINEWDRFIKFGGFPSSFHQKTNDTVKTLVDIVERVITIDMGNIKGINGETSFIASQLLYFFALQSPGEISKGSMANHLDSNKMTINKVLDLLEKTQLIFHIEAFTSSPKRTTKPHKFYFATSSLKHVLSINLGNATLESKEAYMGKLFENFVASSFFNLKNKSHIMYSTYYDSSKKNESNVDFVVQRGLNQPIPIEVSYGKKDKHQIKKAISKYHAPHGIIISNTTQNIVKEDNIIYLPPEIFSFM